MSGRDRKLHEYRLRLEQEAAQADEDEQRAEPDRRTRAQRMQHQALWVDRQIQDAMDRGEFDDLPLAGKPIPGVEAPPEPDWWLKRMLEREQVTGVLPPALGLRREDAELDSVLDGLTTEDAVRHHLHDFNARVVEARRQLLGGPPVITATRDVEHEVDAWHERRRERRRRAAQARAEQAPPPRRRWWRRG